MAAAVSDRVLRARTPDDGKSVDLWSLYETEFQPVRRYVLGIVRDESLADDLVQEVFLTAQERLHTLRDPTRAKPWLLRIARNRCLDHLRSPATRRRVESPADLDACTCGCGPVPEELPALRTLEQQEMSQCVQDRLAALSEEHRSILILFDVLGLTHAEIAETLGITMGSAKVRLHRARKAAREVLNQACTVTRDDRDVLVCVPREQPC